MTCLRKIILICVASVFLLSLNVALAVPPVPVFEDKDDSEPAGESIKKNLCAFFLIDVSESMRPFADYVTSFSKNVGAMKEKGLDLRISRVYAYGDSTASDRDMTGEPNFVWVKIPERLGFAHKTGDRNYAEPMARAFIKVLDEIESLQKEKRILPLHAKLLFILTDAGPNDLTDGAFRNIVDRVKHLNLRVYFVYPDRHGVRNPSPRLDDHPADIYNRLEEMIARFENSSPPGRPAGFRRFQFETAGLLSRNRPQEDFDRQHRRLLVEIETDIDHAENEREQVAAAAGLRTDLKMQLQEPAEEQMPSSEAAERPEPVETAPPLSAVDRSMEIKQAQVRFDEKNYTESLNHFAAVYNSQINNLRQHDQRRIKGLLSLPPKYRAEIIFLMEFERIRKKNNNDRDRMKMDLEDLLQDIEDRQGPWVVIPEIRRERIKKHINEFQ